MDTASINNMAQSTADMGNLLKTIASEKHDMTQKLIGINVAEKVQNQKLGTALDVIA